MTLVAEQVVREAAPISAKTSNFLSVTQFNIVMIESLLKIFKKIKSLTLQFKGVRDLGAAENDNPAMGLTHSLTAFVVSISYYIGFIDHEGALFLAGQLLHLL